MGNLNNKLIIAAIGDSVTAGFHVDSNLKMFFRLWFGAKESWFSKVVKNIRKKTDVLAINYSTPSSKVIGTTWLDRLANLRSMNEQVNKILSLPKLPNMVLIWAGHSVLDWSIKPEKNFSRITKQFNAVFQKELERLSSAAAGQGHKTVIIVFGFINIRNLFKLRAMAAENKKSHPDLFPYFEKGHKIFKSIRPEFKDKTIELADMINAELQNIASFCAKKYQNGNLRILYSEALSKASTNSLGSVADRDGWHPSKKGQELLAHAAWPVIEKQLDFLLSSLPRI